MGEPLVAFVGLGEEGLDSVPRFTTHVVGAELNVAVGLARLGARTAFIGRCGADAFGERITRALRAESVDVSHLHEDGRPTGVLFRSVRPFGNSEVVYARAASAGSALGSNDVQAAERLIAAADWLHVSGITAAISESGAEAVRAACAHARRNATAISFDVNLRERVLPLDQQRPILLELAAQADLVLCGEDEGERLTGRSDPYELSDQLKQAGARIIVVKRGAAGAIAFAPDGQQWTCPARTPARIIDPVGAGDAFAAGLLADLMWGRPLGDALRGGVTCAAYAMASRGDTEGLPRRHEFEAAREDDVQTIVR
jgi:2-dehydro-3-deoxygluconokinase